MTTLTIKADEHRSASEALQAANADGRDVAITIAGRYLTLARSETDRIEAAGAEFAFLFDHTMPDGSQRIITVPVN